MLIRLAGAVAAVALFVACGGGDGAVPTPSLDDIPEAQREILADGVVTEAEYERAVFATIQCLDEHGIPHTEPEWQDGLDRRTLSFTISYAAGMDTSTYDNCYIEFQREVDAAYAIQHAPSEAEQQARKEAAVACMQERGYQLTDFSQFQAFHESADEAGRQDAIGCQLLASRGFDPFAEAGPTSTPASSPSSPAPASLVAILPSITDAWAGLSDYQRALLADGTITREEYEQSVHATVECMRDIGFDIVQEVAPDETGKFLVFGVGYTGADVSGMDLRDDESPAQAQQRCHDEHDTTVRAVFEAMHAPTADALAAAEAAVRACIAQSTGLQPGTAEFREWRQGDTTNAVGTCVTNVARELSVRWEPPS